MQNINATIYKNPAMLSFLKQIGANKMFNCHDIMVLKTIMVSHNVTNMAELLNVKQLYHLKPFVNLRNNKIKTKFPRLYECEKHHFKWSSDANYKLRVLKGLTKFGFINKGHVGAIFWEKNEEQVKNGIRNLLSNQFVFSQIKNALVEQFQIFFEKEHGKRRLKYCYELLGLDLNVVFNRCITEQIEGQLLTIF